MEQIAKEPTMRRKRPTAVLLLALLLPPALLSVSHADETAQPPLSTNANPKAPGLGDPGKLTTVSVETGRLKDGLVTISGRDSGQQIVATGQYDSGQSRDLSRICTYEVSPAGIVNVDATGLVTPIAEGETTIHVVA